MGYYSIMLCGSQHRFSLKADNNEKIFASKWYASRQSCLIGVRSLRNYCKYDLAYERKTFQDRLFYFTVHGKDYEFIGISGMYYTFQARERAIDLVKRNGMTRKIIKEGVPLPDKKSEIL